jgi:hypothetical protein
MHRSHHTTASLQQYNTQRDQYTKSVAKYRSYVSIHDYILNHGYDRKGTYTWVVQHPLP